MNKDIKWSECFGGVDNIRKLILEAVDKYLAKEGIPDAELERCYKYGLGRQREALDMKKLRAGQQKMDERMACDLMMLCYIFLDDILDVAKLSKDYLALAISEMKASNSGALGADMPMEYQAPLYVAMKVIKELDDNYPTEPMKEEKSCLCCHGCECPEHDNVEKANKIEVKTEKIQRPKMNSNDVRKILDEVQSRVDKHLKNYGDGIFIHPHEIVGCMFGQMNKLSAAADASLYNGDLTDFRERCIKTLFAILIGLTSVDKLKEIGS